MDGAKSLLLSKTFWGAFVGIVAASLAGAHYTLSADDQKTIVDVIVAAIGAAGNLFAIYGRVVASKKIGALLLALALGTALVADPARAQAPREPAARGATAAVAKPPLCDPLNLIPGCRNGDGTVNQGTGQTNPLANLTDDVMKKLLADFTYAAALADASGNTVTAPCWHAWVGLLAAQQQPLKDAAGNALAKPDPHVVVDAEYLSELVNQLQPNSPISLACAPALQASQKSIGQLIGAVLSGGALGLFKLP